MLQISREGRGRSGRRGNVFFCFVSIFHSEIKFAIFEYFCVCESEREEQHVRETLFCPMVAVSDVERLETEETKDFS